VQRCRNIALLPFSARNKQRIFCATQSRETQWLLISDPGFPFFLDNLTTGPILPRMHTDIHG
jgi:hypothetical protein